MRTHFRYMLTLGILIWKSISTLGKPNRHLALGMLISKSTDTLVTAWADTLSSCGILAGDKRKFDHRFYLACGMYLGESLCLFVFRILKWRITDPTACKREVVTSQSFNRGLILLPTLCDMTATSLMYIGLTLTYPSVFEMSRGSVVVFTGIFRYLFRKRRLRPFRWVALLVILLGSVLMGVSRHDQPPSGASNSAAGATMLITAQVFVASQVVVEEKLISGYNIPWLQLTGWEGFWGFTVLTSLLLPMYYIPSESELNMSTLN
eukprot:gb/GECG01010386.1/.p1 GENE.gb/GECG01010386.1/~~gb/GECG01010386.1/.p1  ORF type:complete len:264 (+),score=6.30 gb/GECG01010386.1/:1-792(+)